MTNDEFTAELRRRGVRPPATRPADDPDSLNRADVAELLPDFLRLGAGHLVRNAHPLALELVREQTSLERIQQRSGMTTADFGTALASSVSILMTSGFVASNQPVESVCRSVDARNFKPINFPSVSIPVLPELPEEGEPTKLKVAITEATRSGQLRSYGARLRFSRQVWSSIGNELTEAITDYARNVLPRLEQSALSAALVAASVPNISAGMTVAGLNSANVALRAQLLGSGQTCNYPVFALLLPPSLEFTARVLVAAVPFISPARIIVLDDLPAGSFYVAADPRQAAALLRLRLGPLGGQPYVAFSNVDGSYQFFVGHDFDIAVNVAVPGLLKVTA